MIDACPVCGITEWKNSKGTYPLSLVLQRTKDGMMCGNCNEKAKHTRLEHRRLKKTK